MGKHLILAALLTILPFFAKGAEESSVKAELVSEVTTIQEGKSFWVGVHLKIEEDWSTYWLNPGDTGFPVDIEWELPEGFEASDIHWPMPKVFKTEEFTNFGYEDEALLLTEIKAPEGLKDGEDVIIKGVVKWLACNKSCVPGEKGLELRLRVTKGVAEENEEWKEAFDKVRDETPRSFEEWHLDAYFQDNVYGILIQNTTEKKGKELKDVQFFSFSDDIKAGKNQALATSREGKFLALPLEVDAPERLDGILVNPEGWDEEGRYPVMLVSAETIKGGTILAEKEAASAGTLVKMIIFAFIGGLILNLMPCVFPILSLKVLSFLNHAKDAPWKAKVHGLVFALGVLVSFWALSGLLLILRAGGEQLGWGFQLQSPFFITFLCFLLVLMALNFAGMYEIGTSLISTGGRLGKHSGFTSSFSSGVLATILATPCTAPFMGTALGIALAQPALYSLAIFTGLAMGMATPYLVLTFIPGLLKYMPRPGAWMETFKQAMAFPLIATVIWLLWVFGLQVGHDALVGLLFGLLIASTGVWVYGRFATFSASKRRKQIAQIVSGSLLGVGFLFGYWSAKTNPEFEGGELIVSRLGGLEWEKYSAERVEELQKEGTPIFIDFTAAWCLTCQVNKKNVFSSDAVIEKMKDKDIVLMKGDWTKHDAEITKALESYGRSGVPVNVLYTGKEGAKRVVLPELLTSTMVLEALERVK